MKTDLEYDIIIPTRNRAAVLPLSIPLMIAQSRKPRRVIVVDSSDDRDAVQRAVRISMEGADVEWEIHLSPAGLTRQRNLGLRQARSPVVMFPDDDALWHPGVAESIMRIYERDEEKAVGAVCGAATTQNPITSSPASAPYRMTMGDRLKEAMGHPRAAIERLLVPDPFFLHGRSRWNVRKLPSWLAEEKAVQVGYMLGYRMSFRTEVIREHGFDETLVGYGLFEDIDASFQAMRNHLVLSTANAKVFHFRAPSERQDGFTFGYCQIMSRAYLICKHTTADSPARRKLAPFSKYKIGLYLAAAHSRFGLDRLAGARRALREMPQLLAASDGDLAATYVQLRDQCRSRAAA